MTYLVRALRVAAYHMRQITSTARIPIVLLMITCFIMQNLEAVRLFSAAVDIHATPFAFPHLTNDFICQLVIMAGAIVIFCNAPFEEGGYIYFVTRAGRFSWALGQVFYIIGAALLYVFFVLVISVLPLAGCLELGSEWGKIWGTLGKTDAGAGFGMMFSVTEYMVSHYTAVYALIVSFLLEWGCVTFLGLMIYFFNKMTGHSIGTVVGAFLVLLDICIANDWVNWANLFSPITLAQLNTYAGYNLKFHVTFRYGVMFFIIGIVVLVILSILANYKGKGKRWRKNL